MAENDAKAWYRKYRPSSIHDYMGGKVKSTVEARFKKAELRPQVMMISGPRGCGKTTFARLVSKYYLCQNPVDGNPCEECEICKEINETLIVGDSGIEIPGVTEVNATINNKKEAIQELMEDAMQPPMFLPYKVIIFDECHEISTAAQNSLLKLIEDIPPHLIVIFATTDPQKVIEPVKSRCQITLEVSKQSVEDLADRLMYISKCENLKVSREALKMIARKGDRVPRECISLLENVAKSYNGEVTEANVVEITGAIAGEFYMDFYQAANDGLEASLNFLVRIHESGKTAAEFIAGIERFTLDAMYVKHGISLEEYTLDYCKKIKELFNIYTSADFDALLQVLEHSFRGLSENDSNNDVIIMNLARMIGRIHIISKGLSNITEEADEENKLSIEEYSNSMKFDVKNVREKQVAANDNGLHESFGELAQVMVPQADVVTAMNKVIAEAQEEESSDTMSNSELEKLMKLASSGSTSELEQTS